MLSPLKRLIVAAGLAVLAAPVAAEMELSFYSGYQSLPHSRLNGTYPAGGTFSEVIGWQGKPFSMPPYYGVRAMWWRDNGLGFGAEVTHTKAYAPAAEMPAGFTRLEFSDGHNIVTANVMKRWPARWGRLTPYAGAGIGAAVPHVDAQVNGQRTYGYQLTGPALRLTAGVKYDLSERWGLFSEYQMTGSWNTAKLEGGGRMKVRLITNALNFGVSYSF